MTRHEVAVVYLHFSCPVFKAEQRATGAFFERRRMENQATFLCFVFPRVSIFLYGHTGVQAMKSRRGHDDNNDGDILNVDPSQCYTPAHILE